jgi:fatty acid desaturase
MSLALVARSRGLLRYSSWDGLLVGLSGVYAALLLWTPSSPLVALGLWWTANTVAHNFIHTPFFRSRALNRAFALYLSALMGFPQGLWRDRHLRHHREAAPDKATRRKGVAHATVWTADIAVESGLVAGIWLAMIAFAPWFFVTVYLPGYVGGLLLCQLQGHFEHAGGTASHYGWLYNRVFFNDGYHVEHHRRPGEHWTRLPRSADPHAKRSRWPPVLRWLTVINLETLERLALRSPVLQRYLLFSHERAFRRLLARIPRARRVTIVGGGLFPRTALILRRVLPDATLSIIDAERDHLEIARRFFADGIELRHQFFDAHAKEEADLVVVPLSFIGDRRTVYEDPPARAVLVHDWLWNRQDEGVRVSWLLLKRLNLVTR